MGGILSVTIGLFFEQYGKKDVVIHFRPKFYCRYLDDTYNKKQINQMSYLKGWSKPV